MTVLILFITLAVFASDEKQIIPPDPSVSGSFLKPYQNQWNFGFTTPDHKTTNVGTWTDHLEFIKSKERTLMKRVQIAKYDSKNVEVRTENVFDPATMLPVSTDWRVDKDNFNHREFNVKTVQGEILRTPPGGPSKHFNVTFDVPIYDFHGGMYGLLLTCFPLKEGFRASFPAIKEFAEELQPVSFHVNGQEMVEAGKGNMVNAWIVVTEGKPEMTFWLIKDVPYVIKLTYTDAQNRQWFFTMS